MLPSDFSCGLHRHRCHRRQFHARLTVASGWAALAASVAFGQFVACQQFFCFAVCLVTALRPILLRRLLRSLRGLSGTSGGGVSVVPQWRSQATLPPAANALSQLSQVKLEFFHS